VSQIRRVVMSAAATIALLVALFVGVGTPTAQAHGITHTPYAFQYCTYTSWRQIAGSSAYQTYSGGYQYQIATTAWALYDSNSPSVYCGKLQANTYVRNDSSITMNFYAQSNIHGLNVLHSVSITVPAGATSTPVWSYVATTTANCQTFQGTVTNWSYIEQVYQCA